MEQKIVNDPVQFFVDPDNPMHVETPLVFAPLMSSRLGYDIYLKLEVYEIPIYIPALTKQGHVIVESTAFSII